MNLWYLEGKADCVAQPDEDWLSTVLDKTVCSLCYSFYASIREVDTYLSVDGMKIPDPLNVFSIPRIGVIRKDFLQVLGDDARENLYLGKVFLPDGREHKRFLSFRGKHICSFRGKEVTRRTICQQCGRIGLFPLGRYFVPSSEVKGVPLYEGTFRQLVVTDEVFRRIRVKEWKGLRAEKIKVVSDEDAVKWPIVDIPPVPPDPRIIGEVDRPRRVTWVPPPRHE